MGAVFLPFKGPRNEYHAKRKEKAQSKDDAIPKPTRKGRRRK